MNYFQIDKQDYNSLFQYCKGTFRIYKTTPSLSNILTDMLPDVLVSLVIDYDREVIKFTISHLEHYKYYVEIPKIVSFFVSDGGGSPYSITTFGDCISITPDNEYSKLREFMCEYMKLHHNEYYFNSDDDIEYYRHTRDSNTYISCKNGKLHRTYVINDKEMFEDTIFITQLITKAILNVIGYIKFGYR